jgi:hypothetical protein
MVIGATLGLSAGPVVINSVDLTHGDHVSMMIQYHHARAVMGRTPRANFGVDSMHPGKLMGCT